MTVVSDHGECSAYWKHLNSDQTYRLKIRLWQKSGNTHAVCQGSAVFSDSHFQEQFSDGGGINAAFAGVTALFSGSQWFSIHLTPHSQHDLWIELRMQAQNGTYLGQTFQWPVAKSTSAVVDVMLAQWED